MANREPSISPPPSPRTTRRPPMMRRSRSSGEPDERSPLLTVSTRSRVRIHSGANSPRLPHLSRNQSYTGKPAQLHVVARVKLTLLRPLGSAPGPRHHSRHGSWSSRLMTALGERRGSTADSKRSTFPDERVWYDQFTSTDWVHDTIADSHRVKALRSRQDFWGRILVLFDGVQGWILSALSGFIVALVAYSVDVAETTVFDYKDGYCATAWYRGEEVSVLKRLAWLDVCLIHGNHRNAAPVAGARTGRPGPRSSASPHSENKGPSSPSICSVSSASPSSRAGWLCGPKPWSRRPIV